MTTELTMLALSIVLGLVQIMIAANASTRQRGADWNVGPRDEVLPPLAGTAGRLDRALRNFLETFPLFAAAVLIAALSPERHNWMTELGRGFSISLPASPDGPLSPSGERWHPQSLAWSGDAGHHLKR